ncbi:MAG: 30S ribosome-binding factor RbfA [Candidatus Neomarinimicrobiota bacterium]
MAEEVQSILGEVFLTKIKIPTAGMITVMHVDITKDLRIAKVYLSLLNPSAPRDKVLQDLLRRKKEIRYHLGTELRAKYVPELRFFLDESVERSARITTLLEELHRDDPAAKR